ncbi:hypothetical protein EZS27_023316 [termite gut metagenome]|uniref:Uncharacterized protein n=1 Tax=termite gut metagenome TaxID=433724 RepID=A0A5J4R1B8_9ZZZZ
MENYEFRVLTDEEMEIERRPLSNLTEENIKEAINESYVYFKSQPTNKPRLSPYCSALMYLSKYAGPGLNEDEKVRFNTIFKNVMLEKGIPENEIRFDHIC